MHIPGAFSGTISISKMQFYPENLLRMSPSTAPPPHANTISDFHAVARHVLNTAEWVVVVYPDGSDCARLMNVLHGALPAGSTCTGRTSLLPGGGKLSVASSDTDVFVPAGVPYTVIFLGWSDHLIAGHDGMHRWRDRASRVVSLASVSR